MTLPVYIAAALAKIAGCFAFWAWMRDERSDAIGGGLCIAGALVILMGPRP